MYRCLPTELMKIFQHITKSGKKSPYWIVDLGVEKIKVVGKRMAEKLFNLYTKSGEQNANDGFPISDCQSSIPKIDNISGRISVQFQCETSNGGSIAECVDDRGAYGNITNNHRVVGVENGSVVPYNRSTERSGHGIHVETIEKEVDDLPTELQSKLCHFRERVVCIIDEFEQQIEDTHKQWGDTIEAWGDTIEAWGETIDLWGCTIRDLQEINADFQKLGRYLGFGDPVDNFFDVDNVTRTMPTSFSSPSMDRVDECGRRIIFEI